ncbi:hypothetical protein Zmor_004885 [Zophobas morio]|uniref:Uncharacterized protein n=1 Tax=Zophobas morio TaxID=2755281 RepID=A0AA38IS25_9CUCU|nr:hypothetical protein Zmor_004885 [Zophobas morio]
MNVSCRRKSTARTGSPLMMLSSDVRRGQFSPIRPPRTIGIMKTPTFLMPIYMRRFMEAVFAAGLAGAPTAEEPREPRTRTAREPNSHNINFDIHSFNFTLELLTPVMLDIMFSCRASHCTHLRTPTDVGSIDIHYTASNQTFM